MDTFANYKGGLAKLLKIIPETHPRYVELLTLQTRLGENIENLTQFGDSETSKVERMRIVAALNAYSLDVAGISFNVVVKTPLQINIDGEYSLADSNQLDYAISIPSTENFYGRQPDLKLLTQWILTDAAKVVGIFGIGGIGKTSLAAKLVDEIKENFEYPIWYSLLNAPPFLEVLRELVQVLSDQQELITDENVDRIILRLLYYLQKKKCLIVLDNFESLFQSGSNVGEYLPGYEAYGKLIEILAKSAHQSCILLTSRERPGEFSLLEGTKSPVKQLILEGVELQDGRLILRDKGIDGELDSLRTLISRYSGNPLALKLISGTINDLFQGNIAKFINQVPMIFWEIGDVLNEQFSRLTNIEKELIYWLAIERSGITIDDLKRNIANKVPDDKFIDALMSLRRRALVDLNTNGFSLPNVVTEYATQKIIDQAYEELQSSSLNLLVSHALIKAQTKEFIRESQVRLILKPLSDKLVDSLGKREVDNTLTKMLFRLQQQGFRSPSYVAGNVLNLFVQLEIQLTGRDFSNLTVWQAYLRKTKLYDTNFSNTDLSKSAFAETFGNILSVQYDARNKLLGAGTANGEIILWKLDSTMRLNAYKGHDHWVRAIAFHPTKDIVISASDDHSLKIWNYGNGASPKVLSEHNNWILCTCFNHNGKLLASGDADGVLKLWDTESWKCIFTHHGHQRWVRSIAFSPTDNVIATSSEDLTIKLWDLTTGENLKTFTGFKDNITAIDYSPDGNYIAVASYDGLELIDSHSGKVTQIFTGHEHRVYCVAFSHDGRSIASGSQDKTIKLWDIETAQCINTFFGHGGQIYSLAFSPDDLEVASGSEDQTIRIWGVDNGKCNIALQGYTNWVWSAAINSNNDKVVTSSDDKSIRFWDIKNGNCELVLADIGNRAAPLVYSSEGNLLFIARGDHSIALWDSKKNTVSKVLYGHKNRVRTMALSFDDTILASSGETKRIRLWDIQTGELAKILEGHGSWIWSLAFNKDGSLLASCSEDKTIKIWSVNTGTCIKTIPVDKPIWALKFLPNQKYLISGGEDCLIRFWDIDSGESIKAFEGHKDYVYSLAVSSDGNFIVSGGFDHTARIWDVKKENCIKILDHDGWVWSVNLSTDDKHVITGSSDETARVWNIETGESEQIFRIDRPYERMNITNVIGISDAQKALLKQLGAYEI